MRSNDPFPAAVTRLLEEQDISMREMVRRGEDRSGGEDSRTVSAVHIVLQGKVAPAIGLMEFVARGLRVEPETFAEYRMWQARRLFDPTDGEVGFDGALKNLTALEQGGAGADLPLPAGLIADRQVGRGNGGGQAASA